MMDEFSEVALDNLLRACDALAKQWRRFTSAGAGANLLDYLDGWQMQRLGVLCRLARAEAASAPPPHSFEACELVRALDNYLDARRWEPAPEARAVSAIDCLRPSSSSAAEIWRTARWAACSAGFPPRFGSRSKTSAR